MTAALRTPLLPNDTEARDEVAWHEAVSRSGDRAYRIAITGAALAVPLLLLAKAAGIKEGMLAVRPEAVPVLLPSTQ